MVGGKLKVLDLFSGIGGFSLGLERTGGFETVAFCEIEPFPRKVLAKHWPEVPCYDDVRTLTAERLAADGIAVDVITGGFPCQDLSALNRGNKGLDGERSGLWTEYFRLIKEIRPRFAIIENVPDLRTRGLEIILGQLAEIRYDAEWHCVPASAVGAPHSRDRLWLLSYPSCVGLEGRARPILQSISGGKQESGLDHVRGFGWPSEPAILRVGNGVPDWMDRLKALGNAVVPQIPELIGNAILAAMK